MDANAHWQLVDHRSSSDGSLFLQVLIQDSQLIEILVDSESQTSRRLYDLVRNGDPAASLTDELLARCQHIYRDKPPQFGSRLTVRGADVVEEYDNELLAQLPHASRLCGESPPPLVSRTELSTILAPTHTFFLPQTRPVLWQGRIFAAKGPASPARAAIDLGEITRILALPARHPHVAPPPAALITLSPEDQRVCGFLMPLYSNGNLDCYARSIPDRHSAMNLWFKQLVLAVRFLVDSSTWHGDIKPDNILVSDSGDLVLIDLTREHTTLAIAAPELLQVIDETKHAGIPPDWPIQAIEKAEVYAIGRTMFFIGEAITMMDVYAKNGPDEGDYPTVFGDSSTTPMHLRPIIAECTASDPARRPTLASLENTIARECLRDI